MSNNESNHQTHLIGIRQELEKNKKGRLKIFFGMGPGVGKTYAMLEQARRLHEENYDLIVGVVNSHDRKEIQELLKGLKVIPLKWVHHNASAAEEFDLDEVLRIKPQLVIVDELQHTNVWGSRHAKRWQDILELLDAGIDVFTTLNVQHVESRKEIIENITGIQIADTVPDMLLEHAADIELIDITPDELLQRLQEGKVYLGTRSRESMQNFFKEHSLIALREMTLRLTAEKIDHDLHGMHKAWRTRERLMVAVSHNPHSQRLIRATRRLAFEMDALWIAIHIDTGMALTEQEQNNLIKNLTLAHDLGAEVITYADDDLAEGLQHIAVQKNISQILIGRPRKKTLKDYFKKSFLDKLIQQNPTIDIVVLRQDIISKIYLKVLTLPHTWSTFKDYGLSLCGVFLATLLSTLTVSWLGYQGIGIIFILNILILSFFVGRGPLFLAACLNGLLWNYLFIPPLMDLEIDKLNDTIHLILYLLIALVLGTLSHRILQKERLLVEREKNSEFLFEIEKLIANASSIQYLKIELTKRLKKMFNGSFDLFINKIGNHLAIDDSLENISDEKERKVAQWVMENGQVAGWSSDTSFDSHNLYLPLRVLGENLGVLAFQPLEKQTLTINQMHLLHTICQQTALYIHRALAHEKTKGETYLQDVEKAQQAIFHSFSYNTKIPIIQISESLNELKQKYSNSIDFEIVMSKLEKNLETLTELLENILVMAQINSGFMQFLKVKQNLKEIIEECVHKFIDHFKTRTLITRFPKNLPLVAVDKKLISVAVHNLILNALEYSPASKEVIVQIELKNEKVVIAVIDEGPGIPVTILPHIFEKFYQADVAGVTATGLGLGLAVTRAIVELHHGQLEAHNRLNGGATFSIILPL